jgi:uncharacterized membrane protein
MAQATSRASRRPNAVLHGLPGHPVHPPLTDATIGMFTFAAALAVIGYAGALDSAAGKACWLALVGGLIVAVPTAATGFADWVALTWGSPRWRAATIHLTAMVSAVTLFAVAAWLQHAGYERGEVTLGGLMFSVLGFVALTAGGWFGGSVVFVHGVRVVAADERDPSHDTPSTSRRETP